MLEPLKSFAGYLEPGDATRYEMVVVETWDCYKVVVLNDGFPAILIFLQETGEFYHEVEYKTVNPWTIKAAKKMIDIHKGAH